MSESEAYDAFTNGCRLLASKDYHPAVVALKRARALEPDKASIREALGRAYAGILDFAHARDEFQAAVDMHPTDGYAHFGLARCLDRLDEPVLARKHHRLAELFGRQI